MALYADKTWTREALTQRVGSIDQIAGIKAVEGTDGRERFTRMFEVYTGSGLHFRVLADRALDISACNYRGIALAWTTPVGDVHPSYYEPEGIGWLRSFPGGLVTTCGLDQFGAPAEDEGQQFGIHGRISNLPAQQVSYRTYWEGDEYLLEIRGVIRQARLFGENLVLERRILTHLGSKRIDIEDTVTNEGFQPQPHMILYHCNLGFPLLDDTSRLHISAKQTIPRDADAEAGIESWKVFQPPTAGYREQVFRHEPAAGADGIVKVLVENPALNIGLTIVYDSTTLPHLFQWKQMGQGAYVLGIEPANSSAIEGRAAARQKDDLPHLQPGESRRYRLSFVVK